MYRSIFPTFNPLRPFRIRLFNALHM
jgi:hypothetical protein